MSELEARLYTASNASAIVTVASKIVLNDGESGREFVVDFAESRSDVVYDESNQVFLAYDADESAADWAVNFERQRGTSWSDEWGAPLSGGKFVRIIVQETESGGRYIFERKGDEILTAIDLHTEKEHVPMSLPMVDAETLQPVNRKLRKSTDSESDSMVRDRIRNAETAGTLMGAVSVLMQRSEEVAREFLIAFAKTRVDVHYDEAHNILLVYDSTTGGVHWRNSPGIVMAVNTPGEHGEAPRGGAFLGFIVRETERGPIYIVQREDVDSYLGLVIDVGDGVPTGITYAIDPETLQPIGP